MTVERGQVTKIGTTQNGKPWLEIGGKRYFAGRCEVGAVKTGQMIEFEWNEFGEPHPRYGRSRGLQNWAFTTNAQQGQQANGHTPPISALDDQDRPAISNWVAHAIAAGLIKSPTDIQAWALASQEALQALKAERPRPDYDGGMPPYDPDEPPPDQPRGRW